MAVTLGIATAVDQSIRRTSLTGSAIYMSHNEVGSDLRKHLTDEQRSQNSSVFTESDDEQTIEAVRELTVNRGIAR